MLSAILQAFIVFHSFVFFIPAPPYLLKSSVLYYRLILPWIGWLIFPSIETKSKSTLPLNVMDPILNNWLVFLSPSLPEKSIINTFFPPFPPPRVEVVRNIENNKQKNSFWFQVIARCMRWWHRTIEIQIQLEQFLDSTHCQVYELAQKYNYKYK